MRIIKSEQVFPVDIDGTLILKGKIRSGQRCISIVDPYSKEQKYIRVHEANLKVMNDRLARGAYLFVWSANGWAWAETIMRALGFTEHPQIQISSKAAGYLDDKPCEAWMGDRVWLEPDEIYK